MRRRHRDPGQCGKQLLQGGVERRGPVDGVVEIARRPTEEDLERAVEQRRGLRLRHPEPDPPQQLPEHRYGVAAGVGGGAVPCLTDGGHPGRVRALLAHADSHHGAAVDEQQPLAAAFVDRQVGADVGPLVEQPAHAHVGHPVLLVGDGEQPQVALRPEAGPCEFGHGHGSRGDLVLHVHGAAPVQVAVVVHDAFERRVRPVAWVRGHHVGVADEGERGRLARAGQARDQVGAVVLAGDELALDTGRAEVVVQVRRGVRLVPRPPTQQPLGRVAGVEPDQVPRNADDLLVQPFGRRACRRHRPTPSRSRTQA